MIRRPFSLALLPILLVLLPGAAGIAPAQESDPAAEFVTTSGNQASIQRVMKEYETVMQDVAGRYKGFGRWTTETFTEYKVWQEYLESLQLIDLTGCPGDFQQAYREHLVATRDRMESEKKMGGLSVVNRGLYKFFVSGARTKAERAHDRVAELHRNSFQDLQAITRKHLDARTAEELAAEAEAKRAAEEKAAAEAAAAEEARLAAEAAATEEAARQAAEAAAAEAARQAAEAAAQQPAETATAEAEPSGPPPVADTPVTSAEAEAAPSPEAAAPEEAGRKSAETLAKEAAMKHAAAEAAARDAAAAAAKAAAEAEAAAQEAAEKLAAADAAAREAADAAARADIEAATVEVAVSTNLPAPVITTETIPPPVPIATP